MLPTPKKFTLVSGSAEGPTELNAFDLALLQSGIGNLNLLKVSSILPPEAQYVERLDVAPGSLTPTAYGAVTSVVPGERIAAAVAIGLSPDTFGVIMEHSGKMSAAAAEDQVSEMARAALKARGLPISKVMVKSVEHVVEQVGCAFAAVALWY